LMSFFFLRLCKNIYSISALAIFRSKINRE